ncbi:hypothetical protein K443DRAFT_16123 [Laccaria amethystina LaAM-08-1]|uniref:Uncharacterized protein n=1 Tax=Laccaria amethystina LaAM-08-1 TaxID=1095629 RepID=A0A0C9WGH2_9AGAR|nr:hypothetical protein K443DRAFT_16123 [Laccaria amethystina LaAM-08-1]
MHSHLSGPGFMPTPVVTLDDLSFDRCGPKAMIGTFTATTDSFFKAPIEVEAIIKYGRTKIGKITYQTLDFSNGACQLEARFFDGGPNLNHGAREFFSQYFTTKSEINLDVLILKSTSPLQFEAQATGIATLDVKDIIAWVRPGVLVGNADYSITIKHPLPSFTVEIIELSFVATVGGNDLLEGKLENFPVDAGLTEKNTGRHPGNLRRNPLTTLWGVTMNSKVDVDITSTSVK